MSKICPSCGARIPTKTNKCIYCDWEIESQDTQEPKTEIAESINTNSGIPIINIQPVTQKSKFMAALLAFLVGFMGAHKFYLGEKKLGILYFALCWTGIPVLMGFVECFIYLFMSRNAFNLKYNK